MSTNKVHQLLMLALAALALLTLFLLLLEPIVGVIFGLLAVLGAVIWSRVCAGTWAAEKQLLSERSAALRGRVFSAPEQEERAAPVAYELVMLRPRSGVSFPVTGKEVLIGRSERCTCRLTDSATVGREHCRIVYREHSREYYIEDLRSKNGTYLGTRRLEPNTQVKLLEDTEIIVGDIALRFSRKQG